MFKAFTRKNARVEAVGRSWSTTSRHHDILREFMTRWHGKSPLPWDMFNTFNNAGVGDYTWFFRTWFFSCNYSDLTLDGVQSVDGGHAVVVRNPGGMAVPFDVVLGFTDGSSERVRRTSAAWQADGRRTEVSVATAKTLKSVTLDAGIYADANPGDNTWTADRAVSH